jgi:protein-S-isoprenylcysteine O-methyltransferase Ste14
MTTTGPATERTATSQHHRHTDPPSNKAKGTTVAGVGVLVACAIACSLPVLAATGAVASIAAFLSGGWVVGVVLLVAVAGGLIVWATRRRRAQATVTADGGSCDCGGC